MVLLRDAEGRGAVGAFGAALQGGEGGLASGATEFLVRMRGPESPALTAQVVGGGAEGVYVCSACVVSRTHVYTQDG